MNRRLILPLLACLASALFVGCRNPSLKPSVRAMVSPTKLYSKATAEIQEIIQLPTRTGVPVQLPTKTFTPDPTPMFTPIPSTATPDWENWSPAVHLGPDEAKKKVEEMLTAETDCKLPCWWGIEPGNTRFMDALEKIGPMSVSNWIKNPANGSPVLADLSFPVSEKISSTKLTQHYVVQNGIVQEMEVEPGNVRQYHFDKMLKDYGAPQEIWFYGLLEGSSNFFEIYLFDPAKGILAYFHLTGTVTGNSVRLCPRNVPAGLLVLGKYATGSNFRDFVLHTTRFSELYNEKYLFSVKEVTGWDTKEFAIQLSGSSQRQCFDTPRNIWPSR